MPHHPVLHLLLAAPAVAAAALARLPRVAGCPTSCVDAHGGDPGPCQPGREYCGAAFGASTPQFHVRSASCGENDPNFPLFDQRHSVYHSFWQEHAAEPQGGDGQGPVIGHAASTDLVHWARLPTAVWNDQDYDSVAIYTGSATIVNGVPTMVYPGLCAAHRWANCSSGTLFAVAVPTDHAGDALLTNWSKPSYNPVVNNTQRDPSTAWQTAAGEWRFTNFEGKVYASDDFVHWGVAGGGAALFSEAECPDFFALPALCADAGCATPPPGTLLPTHVHKQSSGGQDWYTLGVYGDGAPGSTGTWAPVRADLQALDASALLGSGMHFYASKSFFDPAGAPAGRRVYWGWALVPPASTQTLPRVATYHAGLQRLLFNPLPELAALRDAALVAAAPLPVPSGGAAVLGPWPNQLGNQSELRATFALPAAASVFGVTVGADAAGAGGTPVTISFDPATRTANVSVGPAPPPLSYFMPGTDLPGGDYNVTNVNYSDPRVCQAACTADGERCQAYTYVLRPPLVGSCCLKGAVPPADAQPTCTSGVKHPAPPGALASAPLPILPGDTAIDVAVFTDNTFVEVFVLGGRLAFTYTVAQPADGAWAMSAFVRSGPAATPTVAAWHLGSIWIEPFEVAAAAAAAAAKQAAAQV